MLKEHIIFCHGFALSPQYWKNLAPLFNNTAQTFWDLGYFSNTKQLELTHKKPLIGIGHSLGMLKLMQASQHFKVIIGLNAFTSFLGFNAKLKRRRSLELEHMQAQLQAQPETTLKTFYQNAGLPDDIPPQLNLLSLRADLNFLKEPITLSTSAPKFFILGSEDDPIVPRQLIQDNCNEFPQIQSIILPFGKHNLGYHYANEIYPIIRDFLDGL
jgi:pimeloyl-[acyl-carrier protein] methyl ester esterase